MFSIGSRPMLQGPKSLIWDQGDLDLFFLLLCFLYLCRPEARPGRTCPELRGVDRGVILVLIIQDPEGRGGVPGGGTG